MFAAVGRFAYRRRYLVVILWSLAFLAGLLGTLSLPAQLKGGGFTRPESRRKKASARCRSVWASVRLA